MAARFEEIDWVETPIGAVSLRRRFDLTLQTEVYEVKLGDEFLMSSLFTVAEVELARLGLAGLTGTGLDVVVGGLGLGYTARAALADPRVASVTVVDALAAVIDWHRRGLLPLAGELTADPRTRLTHGDFFAMVADGAPFAPASPDGRVDAFLVDIDHSPRHLLNPGHAGFYTPTGLRALAARLRPGGAFALWSNDPPDDDFTAELAGVFHRVDAHVVAFDNALQGRTSTNTVYVAAVP